MAWKSKWKFNLEHKESPLYDNLSPSNFDLRHVIFSSIQYLDQFDSCEVSFTAESLQYEYSGIYIVKVHDPQSGLVYIDDQYDLQVLFIITTIKLVYHALGPILLNVVCPSG